MPIKVLHIIQGKHFGGAEQVVYILSKCADRNHVTPAVLCLSDGLLFKKLKHSVISCFLIPMKSKGNILIPVLKTAKLIKKEQIDIVHTHTVRSNLIGRLAAFLTRRKCVTHVHHHILREFADIRRGKFNLFIDACTKPLAAKYIAVSNSLRNNLIKRGMSHENIVAIQNALDPDTLTLLNPSKSHSKNRIRAELKIPENAFVLTVIALLRPLKGVDLIIRAMKSLLKHYPELFLLIVGNDAISEVPNYANKLKSLANNLGVDSNVIFTGFRENVCEILNQSDLFVLPSRSAEGSPMVIREAMAVGVPVVASDVDGINDLIKDGVNGLLFMPGDVDELVHKIADALKNRDLLQRISKTARQEVTNGMDGYEQARMVEKVYREVLARSRQ